MELEVVTELSKRPAVEPNDPTALTREQQDKLNQHKVKNEATQIPKLVYKHQLHQMYQSAPITITVTSE